MKFKKLTKEKAWKQVMQMTAASSEGEKPSEGGLVNFSAKAQKGLIAGLSKKGADRT